ncbi:MAG: hypothetical protein MUC57_04775 [Desulfobacterales bacterium]|jgi:hypothetical protein|nr:hypothetical protein [Desulfobacterales bacterium]
MSDSDKLKPATPPPEPAEEDEAIIDLVEEIEEPSPSDPLSPLEQHLLGIGEAFDAAGAPSPGLVDLGKLDFDEEDSSSEAGGPALEDAAPGADAPTLEESMDWLLEPETDASPIEDDHPASASTETDPERMESNEAFPDTREILEGIAPFSMETDPVDEDDDLELIEIEDDEDDEIDKDLVWLDDVEMNTAPASAESIAEPAAPAAPLPETSPDLFAETSAADVFAASVAAGLATAVGASETPPPPEATVPDAPPPVALFPTPPIQPPPSEEPPVDVGLSLSAEQIDAAVERVIERRLGSTLESIILRAVETAVSNEIQRLKALLLDDNVDDRTP